MSATTRNRNLQTNLREDEANEASTSDVATPHTKSTGSRGVVGNAHHGHAAGLGLLNGQVHCLSHDDHANTLATINLCGHASLTSNSDLASRAGSQSTSSKLD